MTKLIFTCETGQIILSFIYPMEKFIQTDINLEKNAIVANDFHGWYIYLHMLLPPLLSFKLKNVQQTTTFITACHQEIIDATKSH